MSVVFYDTAEKLALGNARRMEHARRAARDRGHRHAARRRPQRATPGCSAPSSSRGCGPARCSSTSRAASSSTTPRCATRSCPGTSAGAAVDVFPDEPKRNGDPFESELRGLPNVILTPHIGGSTEEAQEAIGQFVVEQAARLPGHRLDDAERQPAEPGARRSSPACTASPTCTATSPACSRRVNATLAEHGVNIEGQLLATRGELGYVVTDAGARGRPRRASTRCGAARVRAAAPAVLSPS